MFCKCEDITISYEEYGEGEALILLHGNGEDGNVFKKQLPVFSKKYHVYCPDTRGHGKTEHGEKELSFPLFAEDLKHFMDAMNMEKAHILGFSDGGNIALVFAAAYPQRVDKLILTGANLNPKGMRTGALMGIRMNYLKQCIIGNKVKKELCQLMTKHPDIQIEDLHKIKSQTLVIAGEKDMIRESHTRKIASEIKEAQLSILPMADHFSLTKQPEVYNKLVMDFLEK